MLGDKIKELRNKKGIYQQELANILSVSKSTVAMWETNKREPDLETIKKIASYFGVSTDYLIKWEEEWDEEVERLNQEFENNRKVLMKYLGTLFDDDKDKETAYELIINLSKLNHKGLEALNQRMNELCRLEEYINSICNKINVKQVELAQKLPQPKIEQSAPQNPPQPDIQISKMMNSEFAVVRGGKGYKPAPTDEQFSMLEEVTPDMLGE